MTSKNITDMFVGMATAQHDLIEAKLPPGETVRAFVAKRRRHGAGWRSVANQLCDQTGVYTSHTTLRRWFGDSTGQKK